MCFLLVDGGVDTLTGKRSHIKDCGYNLHTCILGSDIRQGQHKGQHVARILLRTQDPDKSSSEVFDYTDYAALRMSARSDATRRET